MLLNRDEIRQNKSFDLLTDAILGRDQPRTADLFFRMVARDGRSVGDALSVVAAAEAPFVQVPSHINVRDGQITLINNDHTILGLRASTYLMPFLPKKYRLLPLLQSVWYIPAGLDIWNQLLGKYPGRYATMKGITVPPPSYGPVVWNDDQEPIRGSGSVEERLQKHMIATVSGDSHRSYGLFLGLAEDEEIRSRLADQLQFLGLIDLQDTVIGRKARNTGHKAIRARSITDLADFIGWERSHGVYYMGVPDMAIGPLYYSLYDAVCVRMASEFPDGGVNLKQTNQTSLGPSEVEDMVRQLMQADTDAVWDLLTAHLKHGKSIRSLGNAIQVGAAELILRTTVPRQFTNGQHPFDYCNVANNWMRTSNNPYQPRILYLMASFINDVAHENKLQNSVIEQECAAFDLSGRAPDALLPELDEAIMALDIPRTTALANAYLQSGADRRTYQATVALAACRFQDDPHNQKITISTFEEYAHNSTHLRDRVLLATARLLAGWTKMPGERDCYARFEKDWIYH
ncbi:MAG TPA: hypothetical protein VKG22_07640 [Stellaceae bacterium]|nr:hypothetical protein [Stellaceae bacterium]HMD66502.1 hypothetical protein [Stellaceae bacterium]